jgi:hypothetical protein
MPDYRTPEEEQAQQAHEKRVRAVLDRAVTDGISCSVAMTLGEPQQTVEMWTNRLWNGLRDGLCDQHPATHYDGWEVPVEDRLAAIVLLLQDRIDKGATQILAPQHIPGGGEQRG